MLDASGTKFAVVLSSAHGPPSGPLASGARSELFGGSLQTVLRKAGAKTVATKDSSVVGVVFLSERVS